jgi:pyruvate dehydrogenase E2 component (dihydrolipoamide acetyltransferase)
MEEGQLVKWLKKEGDTVAEGDVLAEIETDKATMELVARGSGVLQGIKLGEGETAPVGEVIAIIGAEGQAAAGSKTDAKSSKGDDAQQGSPAVAVSSAGETEKPRTEQTGQTMASGTAPSPKQGEAKPVAAQKGDVDTNGRVRASPLARRLANEAGLDIGGIEGSGPGGRITKRDIEASLKDGPSRPAAAPGAAQPATPGAQAGQGARLAPAARVADGAESEEMPLSQMRKTIAKRLAQSIGPIPTFYLTRDIDMTRVMEARERINARLEKQGVKVSVNDILIKAVGAALVRHPEVNASWGDSSITRYNRAHIGVAVAVEDGLITPIVRDADAKPIATIASEVRELAGRARDKKLKPEEYTGATFSISNLGMFGIDEFTAIINPPESAILAVGAVEDRVVAVNGAPAVQPRMKVTMSCDHRVIDGATGARFLQTLADLLEEPLMILV